jgi:DNA-binding response OmpR family regulator
MQDDHFGGNAIVADDRQVIRDAVRSALGETWCVFPARSGAEAVVYAGSIQAALVILDINMPPLNGLDASAEIRSLPGYANVPIVVLTGFDDGENRRKARVAGVDAIVTKPFTAQHLLSVIRPLVAARQDATADGRSGYRQSEAKDILAVYRKVDAAVPRDHDDGFAASTWSRRRDSMR